jgi:hypothetical protein
VILHSHDLVVLSAAMEHFVARTQYLQAHQRSDVSSYGYLDVQLTVPVEAFLIQCWDWSDLRSNLTQSLAAYHDITTSTGSVSVGWWHEGIYSNGSVELTIVNDPRQPLSSGCPTLQVLEFAYLHFREDHCRALATLQRTRLEVKFDHCVFRHQGANDLFVEWFQNNQVVTELVDCRMNIKMLSALSGNESVKRLSIYDDDGDLVAQIPFLIQALSGNMGIEHLTLEDFDITEKLWKLLFRSLSAHPRLKCLSINHNYHAWMTINRSLSVRKKVARMNAIMWMLQHNAVLCTIDLPGDLDTEDVYQNSILP